MPGLEDTREKYEVCLRMTTDALEKLELAEDTKVAREILEFAKDYYEDAKYYAEKGMYSTALEAIAYAHGLLDAGVLAGFFRISNYHLEAVR